MTDDLYQEILKLGGEPMSRRAQMIRALKICKSECFSEDEREYENYLNSVYGIKLFYSDFNETQIAGASVSAEDKHTLFVLKTGLLAFLKVDKIWHFDTNEFW